MNSATASRVLAASPSRVRAQALARLAVRLEQGQDAILAANALDVEAARARVSASFLDRLLLNPERIASMVRSLHALEELPDPVGSVVSDDVRPNGLRVRRVRAPLGVILMIYEARPNVTIEAASLCLKSGNAVILRGGSDAHQTNLALASIVALALADVDLPPACVSVVPTTDRSATDVLLRSAGIDVVIPRGGADLIRHVKSLAVMPVLSHDRGVCHLYVSRYANFDMALQVVQNSKVSRPSACNSLETVLVHAEFAPDFLPRLDRLLQGVRIFGDDVARALIPRAEVAADEHYNTEWGDLTCSIRVVADLDEAVAHIARFGSRHTEGILTEREDEAEAFISQVDASLVVVNASTRFNDGYELGLSAEMGISTTKFHAYGPVGLEQLCTIRWIGYGKGQIRT